MHGDKPWWPLSLAVVVLVVALLVIGRVGRTVIDRARARTAADAAALAGVRDGRARAQQIAERNGARLVAFEAVGDEVDVTVEVGCRASIGPRPARPGARPAATGDPANP